MPDDPNDSTGEWTVSRRQALLWLLGTPAYLGLLSSGGSAHFTGSPTFQGDASPESPVMRDLHPRLFLTPTTLNELRARLAKDDAFRRRWQTAVGQFEASGGPWSKDSTDPYVTAFAAFLTCVRRPDSDLGLRWSQPWRKYRDRIVASAYSWAHDGSYPPMNIALAFVYDSLYHDLSAQERTDFVSWNRIAVEKSEWSIDDKNQWDAHASDDHLAKLFSSLVADDAASRFPTAYRMTRDWADARSWMGYATGVGYEWKDSHPATPGICAGLFALQNAGHLSAAATLNAMDTHLRDAWQHIRQFVIPHPAMTWLNDRVNMTQPEAYYHRQLNVGAHMLWALAILPGSVQLRDASSYSSQATLANSEDAYFGYLQHVWTSAEPGSPDRTLRNVVDYSGIGNVSPSPKRAGLFGFFAFPPWLILNTQERTPVDPVAAGIPKVRRWWPGTLEWTTILSDFSHSTATLITYHHRKWWLNAYEEGCRQNGSWHVHRAGPLLGQRGSASHGPLTRKATWAANGTVSFINPALYPEFTFADMANGDTGGVRAAGGGLTSKAEILENAALTDFGDVVAWHADSQIVAISSNLVRSYNSSVVQSGKQLATNERKLSAFTREFVCVQRGGDGTDHERVFTYDRITLLDPKFEPRYNLCPATNPHIDGTETPHQPWAPADRSWTAVGPTRWDYTAATRLVYDNVAEPKAAKAGNGKVCVTWLQPSSARVRKYGGTNARKPSPSPSDGGPGIDPWNGWAGLDGEWNKVNTPELRAYAGLFTVQVMPAVVDRDTRFLIACDVMAAKDTPDRAESLTSDAASVAARCGATAVVFSKDPKGHSTGNVVVPAGVSLLIFVNLPPGQARNLSTSEGLAITTDNRTATGGNSTEGAPNAYGRLVLKVTGAGTLNFS